MTFTAGRGNEIGKCTRIDLCLNFAHVFILAAADSCRTWRLIIPAPTSFSAQTRTCKDTALHSPLARATKLVRAILNGENAISRLVNQKRGGGEGGGGGRVVKAMTALLCARIQ